MKTGASSQHAIKVGPIKMLEQSHVANRVQCAATSQYQAVATSLTDEIVDYMGEGIFKYQLGGSGSVKPLLSIRQVLNSLDAQDRIRVPHILCRDGGTEHAGQLPRIRI